MTLSYINSRTINHYVIYSYTLLYGFYQQITNPKKHIPKKSNIKHSACYYIFRNVQPCWANESRSVGKLLIFQLKRYKSRSDLYLFQSEALELFTKKNADYGDAFAKYGVIGVLMRIEDKLQRSMSITKNGVNLVNDEGIRDTLLDLHNYSAMALMLLDEK